MNKVNAGIDISKKKFDVRMLFANSNALNRVFRNDPDGFSAFVNFPDQKTLCSALHVPRIRRVYPVPPSLSVYLYPYYPLSRLLSVSEAPPPSSQRSLAGSGDEISRFRKIP